MGSLAPERHHRAVCGLLAITLSLLATACGGSDGGNAPDCPAPDPAAESAAPSSCEEDPGGFGY